MLREHEALVEREGAAEHIQAVCRGFRDRRYYVNVNPYPGEHVGQTHSFNILREPSCFSMLLSLPSKIPTKHRRTAERQRFLALPAEEHAAMALQASVRARATACTHEMVAVQAAVRRTLLRGPFEAELAASSHAATAMARVAKGFVARRRCAKLVLIMRGSTNKLQRVVPASPQQHTRSPERPNTCTHEADSNGGHTGARVPRAASCAT